MSQEQKKPAKGFANAAAEVTKIPVSESAPNINPLLEKLEGKVKVIHGANDDTFDGLVGQTVASVRASLVDAFNIPGDAMALVDGNQVGNDHVLKTGTVLEFIKAAGVKGFEP